MSASAPPLPTREGVGASVAVLPAGPWATVFECLVARFPAVGAAVWTARIEAGDVVEGSGLRITLDSPHRAGLRLHYYREVAGEPRPAEDEIVVFQDAHIVVADKPHFMAVTPSGSHLHQTLLVRLKRNIGIDTLAPVHRIDRETAGLVLFSIDPATRGLYQRLFAERAVAKHYECIAPFRDDLVVPLVHRSRLIDDPAHFMRVCEVAGEFNTESGIAVIERSGVFARYALTLSSGHRHQLRVHCAALGLPIVGDRIYPTLLPAGTDDASNPLRLLARSLAFTDPISGATRRFESGRTLAWPSPSTDHQ